MSLLINVRSGLTSLLHRCRRAAGRGAGACLAALALSAACGSMPAFAQSRVTILYDAFGKPSELGRGWGYAALVEYGGKRILFDTGGLDAVFARNVARLGVDLTRLDFVVLSHRHGDHTSGMPTVLRANPQVKIYAPLEAGSFGTPASAASVIGQAIARKLDGVPPDLDYFGGQTAPVYPIDSPWPGANITRISQPVEVMPGFWLFRTVSDREGTRELNEISLAIRTPRGLAVIVGCSHPGIERILAEAAKIDPQLYTIVGGLHLVDHSDADAERVVGRLHDQWRVQRIAAGHCTGEYAQLAFARVFGPRHDHSGLGEVIALPD